MSSSVHTKRTTSGLKTKITSMLMAVVLALGMVQIPTLAQPEEAYGAIADNVTWSHVKDVLESNNVTSVPYVYGGWSKSGWDCSGFISWLLVNAYGAPYGNQRYSTYQFADMWASELVKTCWSGGDVQSGLDSGTIKPGDFVLFFNGSNAVHAAVVAEGGNIYNTLSPAMGTRYESFVYRFNYDASVSKSWDHCAVYRGTVDYGALSLQKTSGATDITNGNSAYSLEGAEYGIYSDSGCTQYVDKIVTDASGYGATGKTLTAQTYWVKEIKAPKGYIQDTVPHQVTCVAGTTTGVDVKDYPKLDPIPTFLGKIDKETTQNMPQGSASLAGAEFTVKFYPVENGTLDGVKDLTPQRTWKIYTETDGFADIPLDQQFDNGLGNKGLPIGTVTIQETKAPNGYIADDEIFIRHITEDYNDDAVHTFNPPTVPEQVKRGDIALMKFGETTLDGDEQPTTKVPLANVVFNIVNKGAGEVKRLDGSMAKTDETVYSIKTDEQGWASTETLYDQYDKAIHGALSYGSYEIQEDPSTVPDGYARVDNFTVTVAEDNDTLHYILEDKTGTASQIFKEDAETGNLITGFTTFQILDKDKNVVSFEIHYPTPITIDTFTTNADGTCVLPDKLMAGTYYIKEIKAPEGYVINNELVPFTVDSSTVNDWDNPITINIKDLAQKGTISIQKNDSLDGTGVDNATYEIYANEDIITQDGTTRAVKDELVDTITTADGGVAQSKALYLGSYRVVETQQPDGYLLDKETHNVELVYAGQDIEITNTDLDTVNVPTEIDLHKVVKDSEMPLEGVDFGYWNKTDELVISVEEGSGKIAVELDESDAITVNSVKAVAAEAQKDPEEGAADEGTEENAKEDENKESAGTQEENKIPDGAKTYDLTLSENGIYESVALPYGTYNVVVEYTYNGATAEPDALAATEDQPKAGAPEKEQKDTLVTDFIAESVTISEDAPLALYETVASTGVNTDAITETNWYTHFVSAFVSDDKVTFVKTDESGNIITRYLAPGTYGFAEYRTLPGYVLDRTAQYITIGADGRVDGNDVGDLKFENDFTKVQISKTDFVTGEELPGATLEITGPNEEVIETWVSTNEPHMIEALAPGQYTLHETLAPEGYLTATDVEFVVTETGDIQQVEMKDDYTKTDVVKVIAGTQDALKDAKLALSDAEGNYIDIRNFIVTENVTIEKIVFDDKGEPVDVAPLEEAKDETTEPEAPLPGDENEVAAPLAAVAAVEATDGEDKPVEDEKKNTEGKTEENGEKTEEAPKVEAFCWTSSDKAVRFESLTPGAYKLIEVKAPEGYQIAEDVEFNIVETGDVQTVVMEDALAPFDTFDKTGKTLQLALLIGLGVAAIGAAGITIVVRRKKLQSEQ